jgi:hypothetical protein
MLVKRNDDNKSVFPDILKIKEQERMKRFVFSAILILILVLITLVSCKTDDTDVEIKLAPIHEVNISIAESYPPQIFVYIKGGLSDGCTTFREAKVSRDGNNIDIEVTVQRPKNRVCPAIYTYFEENVALGSDFVSGETYVIQVNDETRTFKMQ